MEHLQDGRLLDPDRGQHGEAHDQYGDRRRGNPPGAPRAEAVPAQAGQGRQPQGGEGEELGGEAELSESRQGHRQPPVDGLLPPSREMAIEPDRRGLDRIEWADFAGPVSQRRPRRDIGQDARRPDRAGEWAETANQAHRGDHGKPDAPWGAVPQRHRAAGQD